MAGKGKKGNNGEGEIIRVVLPDRSKNEIFAIADELMGGNHLRVICEDGVPRLARIPGRILKRVWIKKGDLLIVRPWDFQPDRADVVYRYTKVQACNLKRRGLLPESIAIVLEC